MQMQDPARGQALRRRDAADARGRSMLAQQRRQEFLESYASLRDEVALAEEGTLRMDFKSKASSQAVLAGCGTAVLMPCHAAHVLTAFAYHCGHASSEMLFGLHDIQRCCQQAKTKAIWSHVAGVTWCMFSILTGQCTV